MDLSEVITVALSRIYVHSYQNLANINLQVHYISIILWQHIVLLFTHTLRSCNHHLNIQKHSK